VKKRKLLNWSEGHVDRILHRHFRGDAYRIFPSIRLGDAIVKEDGERLSSEDFDFLTRAHLDFLLATAPPAAEPLFAVEFDGPHHDGRVQAGRDVRKNRLCRMADLPLLRLRAEDTQEHERVTLLDYMLERYCAWQREHEEIEAEAREAMNSISAAELDLMIEDGTLDPAFDPTVIFDLRHPFPATRRVRERLVALGIGTYEAAVAGEPEIRFWCMTRLGTSGAELNEQFHRAVYTAEVHRPGATSGESIFTVQRSASVRAWLATERDVRGNLPSLFQAVRDGALDRVAEAWERRINAMWFPCLPGIWPHDIAENLAEYQAYRAVEEWAKAAPLT
jgi:hypothetical protein